MEWQTIASIFIILAGALVILYSIYKLKDLFRALPLIPEKSRSYIARFLKAHSLLMFFFFLGYLIVIFSFLAGLTFVSEIFVGIIFFLGSFFVFLNIHLQSKILIEIQETIQGLLPICSHCKKIRFTNSNPEEQNSWVEIERYISQKTNAKFSHGICPQCYNEVKDKD